MPTNAISEAIIERAAKAAFEAWTQLHYAKPWSDQPDFVKQKYRLCVLAAIREAAIPDDGLRLPAREFAGITLRERLLAKRLRERAAS